MTKPSRTKPPKPPATVAALDAGMFEVLSSAPPSVVQALKRIADEDGVSLHALMDNIAAEAYNNQGEPMPPELRKRMLERAETMTPAQREKFLKPFVS
jgi:hypothetical protein